MTQIAHLSDLHLLEADHAERRGLAQRRLAYLTMGRRNDAVERRRRVLRALVEARETSADHIVVTGDLTEDGLDCQFEILAEVLAESRVAPERVTLLAGNHDVYADPTAFDRALAGPLRAFAPTSAPEVPIVFRDAELLPVSTFFAQPYTRSAGSVDSRALDAIHRAAGAAQRAGRALVVAMHHPPHPRPFGLQWIDGLIEHEALRALLGMHDHAHVIHGHVHLASDRAVRPGAAPRIFGTEAALDSNTPVRLYHARHGRVWPTAVPLGAALALAPA